MPNGSQETIGPILPDTTLFLDALGQVCLTNRGVSETEWM